MEPTPRVMPHGDINTYYARVIGQFLVDGDTAADAGNLALAAINVNAAFMLLTLQQVREMLDPDQYNLYIAQASLLRANIAALGSTSITAALRRLYKAAIASATLVNDKNELLGRAHRAYGLVLAHYGRYTEASTHLETAVNSRLSDGTQSSWTRNKDDVWAKYMLQWAVVLAALSRTGEAIDKLQAVVAFMQSEVFHTHSIRAIHCDAAAWLARLLWRDGQRDEAIKWLRTAVFRTKALDPTDPLRADILRLERKGFARYERWLARQPRGPLVF